MSRTQSYEAIVLLTRDIGEADRFCTFFTREAGKRVARARGVRKIRSRKAGMLLPLRHVRVELRESSGHFSVTSVEDIDARAERAVHFTSFAQIAEGVELLLRLTEDDEPLPSVFDLLLQFRDVCGDLPGPVLPFQLQLLHLLGLLPVTTEDPRFAGLSALAQSFVWSCAHERSLSVLCAMPTKRTEVETFVQQLLLEHLNRPLNAKKVAEEMNEQSVVSRS